MRHLPMIFQSESAECGLACLAMIGGYHGHNLDMKAMRLRFSSAGKGLNLLDLLAIAENLHFNTRAVKVEPETLKHLILPAVLHWDMSHFVVLKRVGRRSITYYDPARGKIDMPISEVGRFLTGVAIQCIPRKEFVYIDDKHSLGIRDFSIRLPGHLRALLLLFCIAVCAQLVALVVPYFSQLVIDRIIPSADLSLLNKLFFLFLGVITIDVAIKYCRNALILHMTAVLNTQMSYNIFAHLVRLPLQFFERRMFTGIVAKFDSLDEIQSILVEDTVVLLVDLIMVSSVLFILMQYDARLVACLFIFIGLYILVKFWAYRNYHLQSKNKILTHVLQRNHMFETVRGIQATKIFGAAGFRIAQWRSMLDESISANRRLAHSKALSDIARDAVVSIESIVSIYLAAHIAIFGNLSIGMLFAFFTYKRFMMTSCISIAEIGFKMHALSIHFDMLGDIVKEKEEIENGDGVEIDEDFHICISGVSVNYGNAGVQAFSNLSFDFSAGDRVVLVGPSGSGKTSFLKAFMRLIPISAGNITINGKDICQVSRNSWARQMAAVMQNDILFHLSLRENIAFGESEIDDEKLHHAALNACILVDIQALPMRFETRVMDMGMGFSAGQIQRILIARALYRVPRLLIMDEGTANMDEELEAKILSNIRKLGVSVLQAAHRPQVIRDGTKIISLGSKHPTVSSLETYF